MARICLGLHREITNERTTILGLRRIGIIVLSLTHDSSFCLLKSLPPPLPPISPFFMFQVALAALRRREQRPHEWLAFEKRPGAGAKHAEGEAELAQEYPGAPRG